MLKIITGSGAELDIKPGWEFEMEFESPLFCSDYIPVAFSTEILLPPTDNNKKILQYIPAFKQPPLAILKEMPVSFVIDGRTLISGTITYSETDEDGNLKYIFTETNDFIDNAKKGIRSFVEKNCTPLYPLMLKDNCTAKSVHPESNSSSSSDLEFAGVVTDEEKYYNVNGAKEVPVVETAELAKAAGLSSYLGMLPTFVTAANDDKTVGKVLSSLFKLDNELVFRRGDGFIGINIAYFFDSSDNDYDWSHIVSDVYSLQKYTPDVKPRRYDNDLKIAPKTETGQDGVVRYKGTITYRRGLGIHEKIGSAIAKAKSVPTTNATTTYWPVRIGKESDLYALYSMKPHFVDVRNDSGSVIQRETEVLSDLLGIRGTGVETPPEDAQNLGLRLVESTPVNIFDNNTLRETILYLPIMPGEGVTDSYVGFVDKIETEGGEIIQFSGAESDKISRFRLELISPAPPKAYENWANSEHDEIHADLNLTLDDFKSISMWLRVTFAHTIWFIKKITLTLTPEGGITAARGEFVSA